MYKLILTSFFLFIFLTGCASMKNNTNAPSDDFTSEKVLKTAKNYRKQGKASWYGKKFQKKRTSSGERYDMYKFTAAHRTLPLSTKVLVTNLLNGRQVVVKINDRGPFVSNRLIDLSYAAAKKLGMIGHGTIEVDIKAIDTTS